MQRWGHIITRWWRGSHVYREGHPSRVYHELHWTARICRAIWTTIALSRLVAEITFFYVARLLTGRRDMRSGWF